MSTTRTAALAERELEACPEQYARIDMELEPGPHSLALVRVLLALGYARIRWRPRTPGVFTAIDEQRIATLVIVDVSPVSDGYPVPRISPGRVRGIHDLCLGYLMDHTRVRKVRADYLAMPSAPVGQGALAVTCRRGVTWAFASERLCAIEVPMGRRVAVLRGQAKGHAPHMALVHRLSAAHAFDTCVRDNGRSWWAALGGLQLSPTEPFGGSSLRGRDRLVFAMAALDRGYSDRRWVMAGSFKAHGFMVARGERPIALGVGDGQRIAFNAEQAYAACGQGIRYGGPLETQDGERSDGREDVVYDPTLGIVLVPSDPDGLARRMA